MAKVSLLKPERVFYYFEKITQIPRGSGNMNKISDFCVNFAKEHNLKYHQDDAKNVLIYKDASRGYENCDALILQGHIDMVCQKTPDSEIDFLTDGLDVYAENDFIKARGTTLGADNGIAVAMIMAILEDEKLSHPPIEAVFTTDEEIGMIGAGKFDMSLLSGKKMINLDMGKNDEAIVSCAGGVDVKITLDVSRVISCGKKIALVIDGLLGGHSGEMIDKGRVNANILMERILSYARKISDFDVVSVHGGDKGNVIPSYTKAELVVDNVDEFVKKLNDYIEIIKEEVKEREPNLDVIIKTEDEGNFKALDKKTRDLFIYLLNVLPNGVIEMSTKITNLVETSLNLGILKTEDKKITLLYTLRSNISSALDALSERIFFIAEHNGCTVEATGHYPPWEYKEESKIREIYVKTFEEKFNKKPDIFAVHAGLECGTFASKIKDLDCIAIGPDMFDIHTVNERLSISKTKEFFDFLAYFISQIS